MEYLPAENALTVCSKSICGLSFFVLKISVLYHFLLLNISVLYQEKIYHGCYYMDIPLAEG